MSIGKVELLEMEFFAHHGCFEQEQIIGNKFIVNLTMNVDIAKPAQTDDINDALNYQSVFEIVRREMMIKSHLLEHIGKRTLDAIKKEFPQIINMTIKIDKLNPPIGGQLYASSVTMSL